MADLTITAASVLPGTGADIAQGTAGETITAGMAVYLKSDGKYWKAQDDGTVAESGSGTTIGVGLNGASAGQPVSVQRGGPITIGATVAVGTWYGLSATAGNISPVADVASTNYATILGIATTTAIINLKPNASGVAHA